MAESHPILSRAEPSAEKSSVVLMLAPRAALRLSELESALGKTAVRIEPAQCLLAGHSRLLVQGPAEAAPAIEKALTEAKLFEEVKAAFDADEHQLVVRVRAGALAPTRAKVAEALEGAKAKLSDVLWLATPVKS
jgi:hypothetical protein